MPESMTLGPQDVILSLVGLSQLQDVYIGATERNLFQSPSYYSREFNIILACVMLTIACYNGASFYIDVFSRQYYKETVEKQKKT